ncbi:PTS sugar transporter subunit IIA [Lacticaseibacillus casei]|jgi:mannitol/fructose-specific phosphotransferase system IIA component (Ntr-type)|uniref:Ascorbate-specific PTS system EIIA component n=1 Tax=Lacticaseibacillus huelsenbergensis TaxID=3035291 RepID=A0ABY8DQG5_9LACO
MLRELVTPEMVQLTDRKMDWKEAIRFAAQPLKNFGFIESRYIDAMIEKVEQYGAFIHIGKGIAMPHARPEDGALKVGISILKVANPVLLLGQKEHAVTFFICLSAIDDTTHLKALAELATFLSDEPSLNRLLAAKSKDEIISLLSGGGD